MEHPIIKQLQKLGKVANRKVDSINSGGCCVFASLVIERLSEFGIPARGIVVTFGYTKHSIAVARRCINDIGDIEEWSKNGISFNHIAVEFFIDKQRYHFDSDGVCEAAPRFRGDRIHAGRMKLKELKTLAANPKGWNPTFDRHDIPMLRDLVIKNVVV